MRCGVTLVETTKIIERVVFDCNIFLQAMANPAGPAGECFQQASNGVIRLFISSEILSEFTEVANRPVLQQKLSLTDERVNAFLQEILGISDFIPNVAPVYQHPDDPKDNIYIDLAIATSATVITTRDKDLLRLMNTNEPLGRDFVQQFPMISVLTPVQLLARISSV